MTTDGTNQSVTALTEAARRRTHAAERAVQRALTEAGKSSEPVTFKSIARAAGVSTDFLYGHPELRARVGALRTRSAGQPPSAEDRDLKTADSVLVRRLSHQMAELRRQHREEVAELRHALEVAHGELLEARRRLDSR